MSRGGHLLRRLVELSCRHAALTLGLGVALAVASVGYALTALSLNTSERALLPPHEPYIERSIEYDREFSQIETMVIAVEAPSVPAAKAYASRLVRELRDRQVPLRRIVYRIDPKRFEGQALLYLSPQRLREIRDKIFDHQEFMEAFAARPTLDQLVAGVAEQIAREFATGFFDLGLTDTTGATTDVHFIQDLVDQISARLDRPVAYHSPWGAFFPGAGTDESSVGFFFSDDERLLFVLAEPESEAGSFTNNRRAIEGTRAVIASLRGEFPEVRAGVTGRPALSNDEMASAFRDSRWATMIAFVLTLALLLGAFRRLGKPLLMLLVLTLSLCWSIGVATLVIGHLSLFSVMFISIVIGIGIDYGIYYLFRYEEELSLGRRLTDALQTTAARTGPGMLVGALTAAGTFYVLMLTDFRGLQELGFIGGSAILLSWLSMITVFPAVLTLVDRRAGHRPPAPRALALQRIRVPLVDRLAAFPKTVAALTAGLTIVSFWGLSAVQFDYDLLNLQAKGTESVVWERRVLAAASRSDFVALSRAGSLEDLRRQQAAFRRLPTVAEVDSVLMFLPDNQEEKLTIIREFAPLVAPIRLGRPTPVDVDRLIEGLTAVKRRLTIGATEAPAGETQRELQRASEATGRLLQKLTRLDRDISEPALTYLQTQLYQDFVGSFQRLHASLSPHRATLADLPPETRQQWVSDRGGYLLEVHPAVNIFDRAQAHRFIDELRSVDPYVTGTAVITFEGVRSIERAYRQGTIYAIVLVSAVGLLMLRRLRETALALLPLGLGLTWTVGLMGLFGLRFTMGNVFALPLVLGAAAEYGLNVIVRFMENARHGGPLVARSTVMAVLVNGLTTIAGFGSLMVADHRGIFGLGVVLTLGTAASLTAALVVLPVLLRLIRPSPRRPAAGVEDDRTAVSVGEDR